MGTHVGLVAYRRLIAQGGSALIRPTTAYDGLNATVGLVSALSNRPLTVTDLGDHVDVLPPHDASAAPEPVLAFHTSGSTGSPKCVVYRRTTVTRHARAIADALHLGADDLRHVALPPPNFAYGLSIVHSHHEAGVPVEFAPATWGLPEVTHGDDPLALYLLPQHTPLLLQSALPADRLRRIIVAGGRLSAAAARALAARFPRAELVNMYGQAELGPRLSLWRGPLSEFTEGTIGHPLPQVTLDLRDETGRPTTGRGRLYAATPYAMSWVIPPPYTQVLPGPPPQTPVDTGDAAMSSPGGDLVHLGRADHVINVAGTKVDAQCLRAAVEDAFRPLVVRVSARAARAGGDDVPVVDVVPSAHPVSKGAVKRVLAAEIGALAGLCDVRIVEELHLTESGK
ncbi:MAG: AMP-binding protein [Mobilicoccus sp.]|nr:AMP-binding protein [Mobilicoccus sp.]